MFKSRFQIAGEALAIAALSASAAAQNPQGHSDIAICCGRNVRGSSPSTSVVPLSNQVTTLNHK
jgi:hypothetical protein